METITKRISVKRFRKSKRLLPKQVPLLTKQQVKKLRADRWRVIKSNLFF